MQRSIILGLQFENESLRKTINSIFCIQPIWLLRNVNMTVFSLQSPRCMSNLQRAIVHCSACVHVALLSIFTVLSSLKTADPRQWKRNKRGGGRSSQCACSEAAKREKESFRDAVNHPCLCIMLTLLPSALRHHLAALPYTGTQHTPFPTCVRPASVWLTQCAVQIRIVILIGDQSQIHSSRN